MYIHIDLLDENHVLLSRYQNNFSHRNFAKNLITLIVIFLNKIVMGQIFLVYRLLLLTRILMSLELKKIYVYAMLQ